LLGAGFLEKKINERCYSNNIREFLTPLGIETLKRGRKKPRPI